MQILPATIERIDIETPIELEEKIGFSPKFMAQCYLPYQEVEYSEDRRSIEIRNGSASLNITPKVILPRDAKSIPGTVKISRKFKDGSVCFGFPYGVKPRLILNYITTYVKTNKTNEIPLGRRLTQFIQNLGLLRQGYHYQTIKDQLYRTCNCSFDYRFVDDTQIRVVNETFIKAYNFWWDDENENRQPSLFESSVWIDNEFYEYIIEKAIPINFEHIAKIKNSPFAIDIYNWATLRCCSIKQSVFIPWASLELQFGQHFDLERKSTQTKFFAREFKKKLRLIQSYWTELKIEERLGAGQTQGGIIFHPSKPPVTKTKIAFNSTTKKIYIEGGGTSDEYERKIQNRIMLDDYQIQKLESFYPDWRSSHGFLVNAHAVLGRVVFDETIAKCAMLIAEGRETKKDVGTRLRDLFFRQMKESPNKKSGDTEPEELLDNTQSNKGNDAFDVEAVEVTPPDKIEPEATSTEHSSNQIDRRIFYVNSMLWKISRIDQREDFLSWYYETHGTGNKTLFDENVERDELDIGGDRLFIEMLDKCDYFEFYKKTEKFVPK